MVSICIVWGSAACAQAQAAKPFPEVLLAQPARRAHTWAYVSMAAGAGLLGGAFLIAHRADDTYEEYLQATDPRRIEELYDRTLRYDAFSRIALLSGEGLVAYGLYLRFVRRPPESRLRLALAPHRCSVTVRF